MEEFNIKLTKKDLDIVSEALSKMPYGLVVQIFSKFQEQISSQLEENIKINTDESFNTKDK